MMYYLYYLISNKTNWLYVGITNNPKQRMASHKSAAKRGVKSPLYDCMRKYQDSFYMEVDSEYPTKELVQRAEINTIAFLRNRNIKILNLADGGAGGYVIPDHLKDEWKAKLSIARQGRKPALGMKHTEENKRFFAECNKRKVPTYPNLDFKLGFKKNNELYGISKTHYYLLLKRAENNELS